MTEESYTDIVKYYKELLSNSILNEGARESRLLYASLKKNDPKTVEAHNVATAKQLRRDMKLLTKIKKDPKFYSKVKEKSSIDPMRWLSPDLAAVKIAREMLRAKAVKGKGIKSFDAGAKSEHKALPLVYQSLKDSGLI